MPCMQYECFALMKKAMSHIAVSSVCSTCQTVSSNDAVVLRRVTSASAKLIRPS